MMNIKAVHKTMTRLRACFAGGAILVLAAMSLVSCVKDDLYDKPLSGRGVVAVVVLPPQDGHIDDYTVEIGGTTIHDITRHIKVSDPLLPDDYAVVAYNTPPGITINDGVARVDGVEGSDPLAPFINPLPSPFYTGADSVRVLPDDTVRVFLGVEPCLRDLRFELTVVVGDPERIADVEATLDGVAGAYDLYEGVLIGDPVSVSPEFVRKDAVLESDLRLLGIIGDVTLTLDLTFTNGDKQTIVRDLTTVLQDFNNGTEPFIVRDNIEIPPAGGVEGSIGDWDVTDDYDLKAE